MSKKPSRSHTGLKIVLILLILAMIAATGFVIWLCVNMVNTTPKTHTAEQNTVILTPAETDAPTVPETTPTEE